MVTAGAGVMAGLSSVGCAFMCYAMSLVSRGSSAAEGSGVASHMVMLSARRVVAG